MPDLAIGSIRDRLAMLAALLSGDPVTWADDFDSVGGAQLLYPAETGATTWLAAEGPQMLALARDLMVINVTKDAIVVRDVSVDDYALPPAVSQAYIDAPRTEEKSPSDTVLSGKWDGYTPPPMPDN